MSRKRALLKLLVVPALTRILSSLTKTHAAVLMLHRFSVPDLGVSGHDPSALRRNLAYLRKSGYNLVSLEELFRRLLERQPLKQTVAFTLDDGYFDHAEIAAPIFAEFDCPVTFFVTTGFLDRKIWFWWDSLMFIFETTQRRELKAHIGGREVQYRWDDAESRRKVWWDLNVRCQDASQDDRLHCIEELRRKAEIELPSSAPARFAPMTWDTVRRLERRGVDFGPHTVTHPVLATTSTAQANWEIAESWKRLNAEVSRPLPIFCYPNGRTQDVGEREISAVQRLGLWGGLMAHAGRLDPSEFHRSEAARYRIPRFAYADDRIQILQCLSGLETVKGRLRRPA
jgi:peptidoglycan/xylan/chitin deacetylase (PgdA/CDA1 family)